MEDYEKEAERLRGLFERFKEAVGLGLAPVTLDPELAGEVLEALNQAPAVPLLRHDIRLFSDVMADVHEIWNQGGKVERRASEIASRLNLGRAGRRSRWIASDFVALLEHVDDLRLVKLLAPSLRAGSEKLVLHHQFLDSHLVRGCPKEPVEAVNIVADFHDFPTAESCLHWLLREKHKIQKEIEKDHEDAEQLGDLLRGLSRLPDRRTLEKRATST